MTLPTRTLGPTLSSGLQSDRPSSYHPYPHTHLSLARYPATAHWRQYIWMATAGGVAYAGVAVPNKVSPGHAQRGVAPARVVVRRATGGCMYAERTSVAYVAFEFRTRCGSGRTPPNAMDSPTALCGGMDEEFAGANATVAVSWKSTSM
jgi:hypothetical protein